MAKRKKIIVIFDIGEAWKRHFILDSSLQVLESETVPIVSTEDDEGDKAGDLGRATSWVVKTIMKVESMGTYDLRGINFTCSSTALVHIGRKGDPIAPLFSIKKAFPHSLYKDFEYRHNQTKLHPIETGSPGVGMVNSGFQMFWLKYRRPYLYGQIRHSLHLPQYFSFLFTGIPLSDFTSIGCHSAMWNFQQKSIHNWVTEENIDKKLAPLVTSWHTVNVRRGKKKLEVGLGMDQNSAALLPYFMAIKKPFILVSTGNSSLSMNPFFTGNLSIHDVAKGCTIFMLPDGQSVLGHRTNFMNAYKEHIKTLSAIFSVSVKKIRKIRYNSTLDKEIRKMGNSYFKFDQLNLHSVAMETLTFKDISYAYHQLMAELVDCQIASINNVLRSQKIKKIIIEGKLASNQVFLKMMAVRLKNFKVEKSGVEISTALGAAIVLKPNWWSSKYIKDKLTRVT